MYLSAFEQLAMAHLQKEDEGGLLNFIHDYLGSAAAVYALGKSWNDLYKYLYMHIHLVPENQLAEYCDD